LNLAGKLKSGIYLQQYAQNNPLSEYVEQATTLYNKMKVDIANEVTQNVNEAINKRIESSKPNVIEITDNDIDLIFKETGLGPQDLKIEILKEKFAQLKAAASEEGKLRLKVQEDILNGLVMELQKRQAQFQQQTPQINLTNEEIDQMIIS
jgi:preprotein translocase subunit SecA